MKARLMLASLFTIGTLFIFVASIVLVALYYGGLISGPLVVALTVIISVVSWLVSPFIQDLVLKWFYACEVVAWPEFESRYPQVAESVKTT